MMFFLPPGSAKTLDISHHLVAHYLSRYPDYPLIGATHTDKFAEQNGRRVRGIIQSDEHRKLFPEITISDDSSAASRWELSNGGMYMGFGVGATVVGRRAGGVIIDDAVAGIAAADSQTERDFVWNWYQADLKTRLVPGGWVIIVMTRYHLDDIAGRLLAAQTSSKYSDKWEVISFPAIAKENDLLGRKPGEALWPEWQSKEELLKIQAQLDARLWSALYQQEPVAEAGNIIKRDWIKLWKQSEPPEVKFVIQSWDTSLSKGNSSAYSSCLSLGVFEDQETGHPAAILLSRYREKLEYYDLRKMAQRLYHNYHDDRRDMPMHSPAKNNPDVMLIEDVTASKALLSDLRSAGVFATSFNPQKYGNKEDRLRLCLDILENGRFYVPAAPPNYTMPRKWVEPFIQSLLSFPSGDSLDDCDAFSQAVIKLKTQGWVYNTENREDPGKWKDKQRGAIYG